MGDPRSDGLLHAETEGKFSRRSPDESDAAPEAVSLLPEKSGLGERDGGEGVCVKEGQEDEKPCEVFVISKDALGSEAGPPMDRYFLVYMILLLHGVAVLMPWNMFINANEYFVNYKLQVRNESEVGEEGQEMRKTVDFYRNFFLSFLGFVGMIPAIILNGVNLFCQCKSGRTAVRVVGGIVVIIIMFIITVALAIINSSRWPVAFFWITMATVVVINMANGVYQNSIYGIAACLPMKYTNAVILGSNISGVITSLIAILAVAGTSDRQTSAVCYFMAAILILLFAIVAFFCLRRLAFYKYHSNAAKQRKVESDEEEDIWSRMAVYLAVFKKCWLQLLGVFLTFFVTLSCFPAVQANVKRVNPDFLWLPSKPNDYFPLVACFLFFNLFAMIGSMLSAVTQQPGPRFTWVLIVARLAFFPFFMLSNFKPKERCLDRVENRPVILNDYVYLVGSILFALSSGYLSSLSMMFAPRNVPVARKGIAGMMAAFFLILGIFAGCCFSFLVVHIIESAGNYCSLVPDLVSGSGGNVTVALNGWSNASSVA